MVGLTLPIYYTQEYATKASKTTLLGMNAYRNWHHFTQNKAKIWFSEIVTSLLPSNPETFTKFHMTYELYYKSTACDGSNVIALIEKFTLDSLKANGVIVDDPETKKIFLEHYKETPSNYKINSDFFTEEEIIEYDLYNIAEYFTVKCFTNEVSVDYYGNVSMNCNHSYTNHIKNGFGIVPIFCSSKRCDCAYAQYKELISPRKDSKITKFVINKANNANKL